MAFVVNQVIMPVCGTGDSGFESRLTPNLNVKTKLRFTKTETMLKN